MTNFDIVQVNPRSHRVHLVNRNVRTGDRVDTTQCGRAIGATSQFIGELADIPLVRRCLQCSGWGQWEQERNRAIRLRDLGTTIQSSGTWYVAIGSDESGPLNFFRASETVVADAGSYARVGGVATRRVSDLGDRARRRECACGRPGDRHWEHSQEGCTWK